MSKSEANQYWAQYTVSTGPDGYCYASEELRARLERYWIEHGVKHRTWFGDNGYGLAASGLRLSEPTVRAIINRQAVLDWEPQYVDRQLAMVGY